MHAGYKLFNGRDVAISALRLYGGRKLDFVDCVLAAEASVNGRDVLTFDKKLKKLIASMGGLSDAGREGS